MKATYLIPLLICSPCSAGLINPIGGSWTDGTEVAEYTELDPLPSGARHWRSLLTTDDGSHVLSNMVFTVNPFYYHMLANTSIDFYDGEVSGQFEFELTQPTTVFFSGIPNHAGFSSYLNGVNRKDFRGSMDLDAGSHTISWQFSGTGLNLEHRSTLSAVYVPEPSTGLGILLALGVLVIYWKLGW